MKDSFGPLLDEHIRRAGTSRHRLAVNVGVDPSYIQRCVTGQRLPPRQHIVEAIARALKLVPQERNRLLLAAGFAPLALVQLGTWSDTLQVVADVLNDQRLSAEERAEFEQVISSIAQRWRSTRAVPAAMNGHRR